MRGISLSGINSASVDQRFVQEALGCHVKVINPIYSGFLASVLMIFGYAGLAQLIGLGLGFLLLKFVSCHLSEMSLPPGWRLFLY